MRQSPLLAAQTDPAASDAAVAEPAAKPVELMHNLPSVTTKKLSRSTPLTPGRLQVITMEVTAYCPCEKCCGPDAQGITASGKLVSYNAGRFVAADTRLLPFGTKLQIPGYGGDLPVEVIDRGGAIKGQKLDVFFPTHEEALKWGRQQLEVLIEN